MTSTMREILKPMNWVALAPLVICAAIWWKEATWFKSFGGYDAFSLIAFIGFVGVAIMLVSALAYIRVSSTLTKAIVAILLSVATLILAREAVILFVHYGYNIELHSYSTVIALVASKRGLLFALCAALCPLLLATILILRSNHKTTKE